MTALQIVDQWLHVPTLKLKAGEMSAQELRTVKAVLKGLRADLVAQMEANPTAQDVSMRYEALNEARQLVLDEALGLCEQRRGDADGRISQALSDAAESIFKRMTKPAAPAAEATTIGPTDSEPPLRLPNEKTNFAWVRWYQFKEGCNLQNAVAAYNKRIKALRASASQGNLPAAVPGST